MKKSVTRTFALLLTTLLLAATLPAIPVLAADDISSSFADANFLAAVRDELRLPAGSPVRSAQAATITQLDASSRGITSLAGIEHLTNLLVLDASENELTALDFSTNPSLRRLDVSKNPLTSLDVRQNTLLTQLNAALTGLTALDVTQNRALLTLFIPGNPQLDTIDLRNNTELTELNVTYCGLSTLDISQNQKLIMLFCANNQLQSISLNNHQWLQVLDVSDNQLSTLNIGGLRDLSDLAVKNNRLTTLNTAQNLGLMTLIADGNQLTNLNLTNNLLLMNLQVSGNRLGVLNVAASLLLQHIEAANNRLGDLNITQNDELVALDISGNQLTTLNVKNNWRLYSLNVSANQFTALDITGLDRLRELDVSHNKMASTSVITGLSEGALYTFIFDPQTPQGTDITTAFTDPNLLAALRSAMGLSANSPIMQSQAALVTELELDNWNIESLDGLELFTNLQSLNLAYNNLTQLDISFLPQLKALDVSHNQLTSLDVSGNPALEGLWCSSNLLEQLDVQENTALTTLDCSGNMLATIWLVQNPALQSLYLSHNLLQSLDLTRNPQLRVVDLRHNFFENESAVLLIPGAVFTKYDFSPQNALNIDLTDYFPDPAFLDALRDALGKDSDESVTAADLRTITTLDASGRGITSVAGLSFLTNLEWLNVSNNQIAGMDISNNNKLCYLDARLNWMENQAAIAGLREAITTELHFAPQKFSGENITDQFPDPAFLAAIRVALGKGPEDPVGLIDAAATETLDLQNKGIQSVAGIEHFTSLQTLNLANNPLQSLDLSRNTALRSLNAAGCCLNAINLSVNTALETLDVRRNHLSELYLLGSRNLQNLNATYNFMENQAAIRLPSAASTAVQFTPQNSLTHTAATCTTAGIGTWTCGNNPAHTAAGSEIKALGHDWKSVVIKPTFTQEGYTTHDCSRCGEHSESDRLPVLRLEYPAVLNLQYNQATSVFADIDRRMPELTWHSGNTKALKIDDNGIVSYPRLGRGTTTVTALDSEGVERVRVNVTVKIVWWQWLIIIFLFGWIWY